MVLWRASRKKRRKAASKKTAIKVRSKGGNKPSADIDDIVSALEGMEPQAKKQEAGAKEPGPIPQKEEAPARTFTFEEVRGILADKSRSGYRAEVKAILTAHGVGKLSEITDPAELAAVAAEAEVIGNA